MEPTFNPMSDHEDLIDVGTFAFDCRRGVDLFVAIVPSGHVLVAVRELQIVRVWQEQDHTTHRQPPFVNDFLGIAGSNPPYITIDAC
jgi:hypothetical protein